MDEFANTVGVYEGSLYVNDFNLFGRTWEVIVQAEAGARSKLPPTPWAATTDHGHGAPCCCGVRHL